MLYTTTLNEIETNINTGVEYEIALFAKLIEKNSTDYSKVMNSIRKRHDSSKVLQIMKMTNIQAILNELAKKNLNLKDVTFETQNDEVGPADIVMVVEDSNSNESKIGLSVKYANTCTLNVTGKNFITDSQIANLRSQLHSYSQEYIQEMTDKYDGVENWFRKRRPSKTTDAYIDLIRDAVIENWPYVKNKEKLLSLLFHSDSPIPFWVVTYKKNGYELKTVPQTVDVSRAKDVTVGKYQTSYVAFYLDNRKVGHMQVKFNNGFVEKCKKKNPDITCEGVKMSYGQPFSSWNFSVEK
ncbi:MAG: hypothetical protein IJJ56_08490 [Prevotella sp.]|nr:hypothetical protein [Prevotella sp.]